MSLRTLHRNRAIVWASGIAATLGIAAFLLRLVDRARAGGGLIPYTSGMGIETSPVQVLTTVLFLAAVALTAGIVILIGKRRSRPRGRS